MGSLLRGGSPLGSSKKGDDISVWSWRLYSGAVGGVEVDVYTAECRQGEMSVLYSSASSCNIIETISFDIISFSRSTQK